MGTRSTITPGSLFRMLRAEFEARRPAACADCRLPLPRYVERAHETAPNWALEPWRTCRHDCAAVIAELAKEFAARYDMIDYSSPREMPSP